MLAVFGGTIGRHGLVVAGVCESRVVPTRVQCSSVPTRDRKAKVMRMMMARRGEARRGAATGEVSTAMVLDRRGGRTCRFNKLLQPDVGKM